MGDNRISLKIEIKMHGKTQKVDSWINWSDRVGEEYGEWIQDTVDKIKNVEWSKQNDARF